MNDRLNKTPEFTYHLLRGAVERFSKGLAELDEKQYEETLALADKTYALESLVLSSDEARDLILQESRLDEAIKEIVSRYPSHDDFLHDMASNGLDESSLRQALQRELLFDAVMERVAVQSPAISDLDIRLYYELNKAKFTSPEKRSARHILITINPDFPENTPEAALGRIEEIAAKIHGKPKRFIQFARENSECPTAMQDGKLGDISRGTLYSELDAVLFQMEEGEVSEAVETEVGYHLLLCEKIQPARTVPRVKVESRIRGILEERQRRACQKAWLEPLRGVVNDN